MGREETIRSRGQDLGGHAAAPGSSVFFGRIARPDPGFSNANEYLAPELDLGPGLGSGPSAKRSDRRAWSTRDRLTPACRFPGRSVIASTSGQSPRNENLHQTIRNWDTQQYQDHDKPD
jgi:hypothetical protein